MHVFEAAACGFSTDPVAKKATDTPSPMYSQTKGRDATDRRLACADPRSPPCQVTHTRDLPNTLPEKAESLFSHLQDGTHTSKTNSAQASHEVP